MNINLFRFFAIIIFLTAALATAACSGSKPDNKQDETDSDQFWLKKPSVFLPLTSKELKAAGI